jgi:hypothetical protein
LISADKAGKARRKSPNISRRGKTMENLTRDLIIKVKPIYQGPNADLLRKLAEVLDEQAERREEYDEEPFSAEDLAAIQEGEEACKRGEFISLKDYEKERGR